MKSQTYIEVNGKRYDAKTGKLLGISSTDLSSGIAMDDIRTSKTSNLVRPTMVRESRVPQKSQTLMRASVKKPTPTKRAPMSHETGSARSPLITKFGDSLKPVQARVEPVMLAHQHAPSFKSETSNQQHHRVPTSAVSHHPKDQTDALVSRALASSDGHNAPKHAVTKHHRVSRKLGISHKVARFGSAGFAVLLLGTFFAYQSIPNFAMRVAATRAGFDAQMPNYHPSGFGFRGPVQYRSGEVIVHFGSNTRDGREFALTQRASNWNNDALLANFVLNNDSQYQTFQDRAQTIYIYDGSNATWVKDGVWYQLEGNASLTTDQISSLAASI